MFNPCSPEKPYIRVPTVIPYNKQSVRFKKQTQIILDKNYENDPGLIRKKIRIVNMAKTMPRKPLFKHSEYSMNYEPNKEVVMEDLGKVLAFKNMSKRKELFIINPTPDPYDANFSAVEPNEKSFSMEKRPEMFKDNHCPLPSFMQTVHSRLSMCYSSMKSVQSSKSCSGFFQAPNAKTTQHDLN